MGKIQDLNTFKMPKGFRGRSALVVQLWWIVEALFVKTSPQALFGWRRMWWRLFGAKVGKSVKIRSSVSVTYPWKVTVGDYAWIGDEVVLYSLGEIKIGDNVVISQKCYLCTGNHKYTRTSFDIFSEKIVIEEEAWLATDVFVGPGVTVGKGAVVGARSTVLKNIEGGFVYAGNPLQKIKQRTLDS